MRRSLRKAWATRAPLSLQDVSIEGCMSESGFGFGGEGAVVGPWLLSMEATVVGSMAIGSMLSRSMSIGSMMVGSCVHG